MKIIFNKEKILALMLTATMALSHGALSNNAAHAEGSQNVTTKITSNLFDNDQLDQLLFTNKVYLFANPGYVVADLNVWLRMGPGVENDKCILIHGGKTLVAYGISENGWYLVEYDGKLGFASSSYLTNKTLTEKDMEVVDGISVDTDTEVESEIVQPTEIYENVYLNVMQLDGYVYANKNVNFRETAGYSGKKITTIKKGEELRLLGYENGWYLVEYKGKTGYVLSNFVSYNRYSEYRDDFVDVVYIKNGTCLMHEPGNEATSKYFFDRYEVCEVLGTYNEWYLVRYGDMFGYVRRDCTREVANTAVVIDIDDQRLTLYKDDQIVVETDVVTGTQGLFDTPTGMYSIRVKMTNTSLTSEEYGYDVPVEYWMPFNGGIGLHDASWRRKFGDNIYINDGSHGCVNIPPKYADDVFNNVKVGTKVLVHK